MARLHELVMKVTEETIAEATGLPQSSERWFKKQQIEQGAWS
jgi:hypothetical protein